MEAHHLSSQTLRFKPLPVGLETFRALLKRRAAYTCTIPCHHLAEKKCMVANARIARWEVAYEIITSMVVPTRDGARGMRDSPRPNGSDALLCLLLFPSRCCVLGSFAMGLCGRG